MQKIIIVDANGLVHRAYHALPPLSTSNGEQTNATFGFASMLLKVLADEKPDFMAIAFDRGRTFRHDAFPEYKAQRPTDGRGSPASVRTCSPDRRGLWLPHLRDGGLRGRRSDRDPGGSVSEPAAQCSDRHRRHRHSAAGAPGIEVLVTRRGISDTVTYDEAGVRERYGLEPAQLTDLRGLRGDASDNLPQIPGIGDKTAATILQQFGTVENTFAHLDAMDAKLRAKLEGYQDQAVRNKYLATIVCDLPVTLDLEKCACWSGQPRRPLLLFRELEFRSMVDRIPAVHVAAPPASVKTQAQQMDLFGGDASRRQTPEAGYTPDTQVVDTPDALTALIRPSRRRRAVVDVESTSPQSMPRSACRHCAGHP